VSLASTGKTPMHGSMVTSFLLILSAESEMKKNMVAPMHSKEKDAYFDSYSHYYIHEEMLKDRVTHFH